MCVLDDAQQWTLLIYDDKSHKTEDILNWNRFVNDFFDLDISIRINLMRKCVCLNFAILDVTNNRGKKFVFRKHSTNIEDFKKTKNINWIEITYFDVLFTSQNYEDKKSCFISIFEVIVTDKCNFLWFFFF